MNQNVSMARFALLFVLKSLMLTILMAEVFPEIQQNNALMCHILDRWKVGKDGCLAFLWYSLFLLQGVISHIVLLLSIITILSASIEIAILNDSIGILVLSTLHTIGSKLILEDFKIRYNKTYTDGDFL